MPYDRGPIDLLTDEDFPVAGPPSTFTASAVDLAATLGTHADALGGSQLDLGDAGDVDDGDSGLDLGAIADELDRQSGGLDPSISDVAGSADAIDGEFAGLSIDVTSDLDTPIPDVPIIPGGPAPDFGNASPAQLAAWDGVVGDYFQSILGRAPSSDEIAAARAFFPNIDNLQAWIRDRGATPGSGSGGSGGSGAGNDDSGGSGGNAGGTSSAGALLDAYKAENPNEAARIDAFLASNPGDVARAPAALELSGWADFVRRHS